MCFGVTEMAGLIFPAYFFSGSRALNLTQVFIFSGGQVGRVEQFELALADRKITRVPKSVAARWSAQGFHETASSTIRCLTCIATCGSIEQAGVEKSGGP